MIWRRKLPGLWSSAAGGVRGEFMRAGHTLRAREGDTDSIGGAFALVLAAPSHPQPGKHRNEALPVSVNGTA